MLLLFKLFIRFKLPLKIGCCEEEIESPPDQSERKEGVSLVEALPFPGIGAARNFRNSEEWLFQSRSSHGARFLKINSQVIKGAITIGLITI